MSMKMKNYFKLLLSTVFAVLLFASCERGAVEIPLLKMSADSEFKDSYASISFALSKASGSDISISLLVLDKPSEGNSCVAASKLTLPSSVVVSAGSTSVKLDVALAEDAVGTEAVIAVGGVVGASLEGEGVARIKTGQSYSGGGQGGEGGGGGEGGQGGEGGDIQLLGPLTLQSGWKAVYSGNYRVDVSGVTDAHFMFDLYSEPIADAELEDALIYMVSYNLSQYGYVYDGPADYDEWESIEAGTYYVYIAGLDENNNLTGNYAFNTITVGSGGAISGGGEDMQSAHRKLRHNLVRNHRLTHRKKLVK